VTQPIGEFYLTAIPAEFLVDRVEILSRTTKPEDKENVQREYSGARLKEISQYVEDPDATFPTSIIIASSSNVIKVTEDQLEVPDSGTFGEVIDGQHRLRGLQLARGRLRDFTLPVVFMMDLEPYERAYVFSIINSKQTPVGKSLIYDLFGLSNVRSPQRSCHEIARAMNSDVNGPLFRSIKMLGRKESGTEFLTQGSFAQYLLMLISRNPSQDLLDLKKGIPLKDDPLKPFRKYWIANRDNVIHSVLRSYFSAVASIFKREWDADPKENFIIRRTVGFSALMKSLYLIWPSVEKSGRADKEFFMEMVAQFLEHARANGQNLTTAEFSSSEGVANSLARLFVPAPPNWENHGEITESELLQLDPEPS